MTTARRYIAALTAALRSYVLRSRGICPVHGEKMEKLDVSDESGWPAHPWVCRRCEPAALDASLESAEGSEAGWACDTD